MPIIHINTNAFIEESPKKIILSSIAQLVSDIMKKPFEDIMVLYSYCDIIMFNSYDNAAFIDFRLISGLNLVISKELCIGMADILHKAITIDPSRIYINFFEAYDVHAWRFINGTPVCPATK